MHLTKGLMENAIHLTFNVTTPKIRKNREKKIPCAGINAGLVAARSPVELSRRTREIDEGTIKTEELRNYALIFFPLFVEAISEVSSNRPEIEIWLLLAFLLRAYNIPGERPPIPGRK